MDFFHIFPAFFQSIINLNILSQKFLKWNIFFFQVLDLPYERMPPRKDAPVTPEDTGSAADGDSAKANNSNG